ncbi:hypothetical protein LSUE1_G006030 [Lachnellula suecica]|uniref:Uncharacterized protein n=1 Tax=Lachnellula suecica TaxID=602035 RepID=A0A8T9C1K0_9HELO|nr:hypothetical protein LSUE1_G006030 [Lachnellula suecica]
MAERKEVMTTSESSIAGSGPQDIQTKVPKSIYQKIYNFFGFSKAYNFNLWVIFAGAMFGFSLSRLEFLNYDGNFSKNTNPGYWYSLHAGSYRVGMIMHLATVLPAGLLMVLQFVPKIRHRYIMFHRINGYLLILLLVLTNVGAMIVLRHNDSGTRMGAQTAEGFLVIITMISMGLAYWNIKRLQIDQHRAWMLRAMFYFGTIITTRIFVRTTAVAIGHIGNYYQVWTCDKIDFTYKQFGFSGILALKYPQCLIPGGTLDGRVVVKAEDTMTAPENGGAGGALAFEFGLWLSVALHIIGVEIYLSLTPRESKRLRQVSYERQLAAGFKNPGNSGTTVQRWGDAEDWEPTKIEQ